MKRTEICKNIIQLIKDYITNPEILEQYHDKKSFVRKRKLSMFHVILFLFYSSKASMSTNIGNILNDLGPGGLPNVSKQSISKARQHIQPSIFRELFTKSVSLFYQNVDSLKRWNGYLLFAIDGSKIQLPLSDSCLTVFGKMFTYPHPERVFTMGLASMIYDVLNDHIVHASLNRYLLSERVAAMTHLRRLLKLGLSKDSIVIFDRGYYSEAMFRYCAEREQLCLMRLKEGYKISKKSCGLGDIVTFLPGNIKKGTEDLKIRIIEVDLDNGTKEYLATNLFDKTITQEMFRELYFYRWPVETKYNELKNRFLLEEFNGATARSVFQEFYINLLLSNLVSLLKNDADEKIAVDSKETNKYTYQANRSFIIGRLKKILPKILVGIYGIEIMDSILKECCRQKSQIAPGRKYPRKNGNMRRKREHNKTKKAAF